MKTGRFAPSPTGRMHLGNLFTALLSWLSVRKAGGRWILRIEDLDPQRSRMEYARQIEDDLDWLQAVTARIVRACVTIYMPELLTLLWPQG